MSHVWLYFQRNVRFANNFPWYPALWLSTGPKIFRPPLQFRGRREVPPTPPCWDGTPGFPYIPWVPGSHQSGIEGKLACTSPYCFEAQSRWRGNPCWTGEGSCSWEGLADIVFLEVQPPHLWAVHGWQERIANAHQVMTRKFGDPPSICRHKMVTRHILLLNSIDCTETPVTTGHWQPHESMASFPTTAPSLPTNSSAKSMTRCSCARATWQPLGARSASESRLWNFVFFFLLRSVCCLAFWLAAVSLCVFWSPKLTFADSSAFFYPPQLGISLVGRILLGSILL